MSKPDQTVPKQPDAPLTVLPDKALSKVDFVYEKVRVDIINHKYELGDVLNEKKVADEFNMSKTPVREAFSRLVEDGYLMKYPRFGYIVKDMKLAEYYQITQLRYILESGCISHVIANVDDASIRGLYAWTESRHVPFNQYYEKNVEFHLQLAALLGNPYIDQELQKVLGWLNRDLSRSFYDAVDGDIHVNHRNMIAAMLERDEAKALAVLREELRRSDDPLSSY